MKKILLLIIVIIGLVWFAKKYVGDVRPAAFSTKQTIRSLIPGNKPQITSNVDLTVPDGFAITSFARDVSGARDLQFSSDGTLLVSQPSEGRIVALPDRNNDGVADEVRVVLDNLERPHGIAFRENKLFVAEETRASRYTWNEEALTATLDKKLFDLPAGGRHFTRTIAIEKDGTLYVSLGSTCDACFEKHPFIGTIIISTTEGKKPEVFSKGLRNSVFITLDKDEKLWGTEMGRDFLGDTLPPDEVNILGDPSTRSARSGQNPIPDFGWPVCYGDKVYDEKFGQKDASYCNSTKSPAFKLPSHVAPLGLTFINSDQFPKEWQGDLLVGLHGSWNSSVPVGYKVVRLNMEGDKVLHMEDFITGFIRGSQADARPVDVEFSSDGSLYVSDDKAGMIYRVAGSLR